MDEELEAAQKLTKDDLLAKLRAGRPAKLARPRDLNQLVAAVVEEATTEPGPPPQAGGVSLESLDVAAVVFTALRWEEDRVRPEDASSVTFA